MSQEIPPPLRIGVSACFFHADPDRALFKGKTLVYAEESMLEYVMREGAFPLMLPRIYEALDVRRVVDQIDGLLLQGGTDVSPLSYGEAPMRPEWSGDKARDDYEIALIKECVSQKIPIYGICRGAQILNVAMGGTMYQDVETQNPGALVHRKWEVYDELEHEVEIYAGTHLASLYGTGPGLRINSIHHQAIKDVAPGFKVEAISPKDGIIEAIRMESEGAYTVGVQWHPEFIRKDQNHLLDPAILMKDFLAAVWRRKI